MGGGNDGVYGHDYPGRGGSNSRNGHANVHMNTQSTSRNSSSNRELERDNERANLLASQYKDSFHIDDLSRRNNYAVGDTGGGGNVEGIFGKGSDGGFSNENLKTLNLNDIKRGVHGNNAFLSSSNNMGYSLDFAVEGTVVGDKINTVSAFPSATTVTSGVTASQQVNGIFEKAYSMSDMDKQHGNNISGKMNIIDLSANGNEEKRGDIHSGNNSFELFPFFKSLSAIRNKVLCYYDVDNDVIIYRCMCALVPYLQVDKTFECANNFNDIENNVNQTGNRNMNTLNSLEKETYDENEHIRNISNIHDAFDSYDNKLSVLNNPDVYGFVWLNMLITCIVFFLFNLKNIFYSKVSFIDVDTYTKDTQLMQDYIETNKLTILYSTILFVYLFTVLVPTVVHVTNYLLTKKIMPIKLSFLISLMSYNNITLIPVIFMHKLTSIETNTPFLLFVCSTLRFLVFLFYIITSVFYIYKYTIRVLRNNFADNITHFNYAIFAISYMSFYFLLRSYIFNYL
ncbi:conserved Plasmodium protein, unknown function [Plasmodium ovale]|uniref:Uncharacterized protein n=1 Tax=Plasmodium ovale TaxID=36330 RepID=A0A1D3KY16_PLAOA|nr:conserved Plasmodium protein, unknown function [Plasmodium ovale]